MPRQDSTDQADWVRGELLIISLLSRLRGAKRNQTSWVCVYLLIFNLIFENQEKRTPILFQIAFLYF